MKGTPPPGFRSTLDPPDSHAFKRERGTWVWRERDLNGRPTVIKLYRHRGTWCELRSRLTRFRVEREFRRLRHLERWGVPCTRPLGWAFGRSGSHGVHECLIMEEAQGAIPLVSHLRSDPGRTDLTPLFRQVRRMHESGFCNQTLFASNVLIRPDAPPDDRFLIADVPRSWTFPRTIAGTRMAWFDLLDLTLSILETGVPFESVPLSTYGLGRQGQRWWNRHGPSGDGEPPMESRTKKMRFRRDVVARLRWAAAWCRPGRQRPDRTSSSHGASASG